MPYNQTSLRQRPYWHVDAKWIAGILLFISLGACLLLYNLAAITERDTAVSVTSTLVANLLSQKGLDDASGLAEFRQQAAATPGNTIAPIPEFPSVKLTKQQALTLSPRELKLALTSQITGPIYDKGLEAAAAGFTSDSEAQKTFINQASLLGVVNASTHTLLQKLFVVSLLVCVVFAAVMVFFSTGWGRLVSLGAVLVTVSPLGTVAGLGLRFTPKSDPSSVAATLPPAATSALATSLSHSYAVAMLAGIGLLIIAGVGKLLSIVVHSSRNSGRAEAKPETA